ncbi:MAG: fimbrial protein [Dysgonomonas sp.]|nr:fimbrial protein [Dysgonomonas sp.]
MNIKKYINVSLIILLAGLIYSCSGDNVIIGDPDDQNGQGIGGGTEEEVHTLSICFNQPEQGNQKSASNPDATAESQIYNVDVLIFRSQSETDPGKLDANGYTHVKRTAVPVLGQNYDQEYKPITEVKQIKLTAGKRDVYVIVNAPKADDNVGAFADVTNITEFKNKFEELKNQGLIPYPGSTPYPDPEDGGPIGGINTSELKTNLTMCGYKENILFDNLCTKHYMGYTSNGGRPTGVLPDPSIGTPDGTNPFLVERLVARVALKKVTFDFSAAPNLEFEAGFPVAPANYTYQLDSIFLLNVKTGSRYFEQPTNRLNNNFGHGCKYGFAYLNTASRLNNLNSGSVYTDYLCEPIFARDYNIETSSTPLWFYTFENDATEGNPTYLVIGVRFNFKSAKDGLLKTVKAYYPVVMNKPGTSALHSYIKRNNQYRFSTTIKGLGSMYSPTAVNNLRSALAEDIESKIDNAIEVETEIGPNLFPWTGTKYK